MGGQLVYRNSGNRELLALLPDEAGRILDCGCGPGDNAEILSTNGWQVTGITIDPAEREAALPFCEAVLLGDLERGLPDGTGAFDVVLMSHVLEHLARPEALLTRIPAHLASGGLLAVALPNVLHYRQRLRFLRGDFTYTATGILDRTHLRFFTFTSARELLEAHGFELVRCAPDGSLPWWRLRSVVPRSIRTRLDRWALARWPDLFAHQSLFLAKVRGRSSMSHPSA